MKHGGLLTLITLGITFVHIYASCSHFIVYNVSRYILTTSLLLLYQVVDKMQSGGAKNDRRADLPTIGLGEQVIEELETLKAKDVDWQGKCSGTVYVHLILRVTDNKLKLVHPITFQFIRL